VTVVIPARDEARSLPTLLDALAGQRPAPAAVIVVDDGSTDGTGALARSHRAVTEVVSLDGPPPGWAGKPWALACGVERAPTSRLAMIDADVWLAPGAIGALASAHRRLGGLLSVAPHHDAPTATEALSAPFNAVALAATGAAAAVGPGDGSTWAAFGPCLLLTAADLEACGGWAAVRASVVEDLALAERARRAGLPVRCLTGGSEVRYRMYPAGLGQLVEGWTKNMAAGARRTPPWWGAAAFCWVAALVAPLAAGSVAAAAVLWALVSAQAAVLFRRVGSFPWWTPLVAPLLGVVFVAVFIRSLVLLGLRRPARWRGRRLAPPAR
jgi:4,4'-diaponeurosporenoate glycosyltransferase